ncbi:MAG TPA: methyltransferase [Elusimicrobiota bacterium]|nr:methyltransferase [Elusimicrobiota bacterium]
MSNRLDRIDSPAWLAKEMVDIVSSGGRRSVIADFTAGKGNLLVAAQTRWPRAQLLINDKSSAAARDLEARFPKAKVVKADFLRTRKLDQWKGKVSLALLNPPFSCRGAKRHGINLKGDFVAGTGVAFLMRTLEFLSPTGQAVAVLPAGCMSSEKDEAVWKWIRQRYIVTIHRKCNRRTFESCVVGTVVVSLKKRAKPRIVKTISRQLEKHRFSLIRGKIQIHNAKWSRSESAIPLVHSTNLQENSLTNLDRRTTNRNGVLEGPAVLLPRVGKPSVNKIAVLPRGLRVVLSDCVIAIPLSSSSRARRLMNQIRENWQILKNTYQGSCAPYTTMSRVGSVLSRIT